MADFRERVLFSTSSDYFPAAERELRDLYGAKGAGGGGPEIERLGPDLGRISGAGCGSRSLRGRVGRSRWRSFGI
ncbi:hypothetical protein [Nocardia terpenica]|uniref:hypothetical protein n=1 Tax=Nocardia terpenica TaxID=455432 RepID=UPI0019334E9E|nr:hypothetical protein [Nocardia terpenica]